MMLVLFQALVSIESGIKHDSQSIDEIGVLVVVNTRVPAQISELVYSCDDSICSFVGIAEDFFDPCAANGAVCSVLMGHQQITA
jgi:hypothetical protein